VLLTLFDWRLTKRVKGEGAHKGTDTELQRLIGL
jgi:hypothetical protein